MGVITRTVTGKVILPDGSGVVSGFIRALPVGTMPGSDSAGLLLPSAITFPIVNGDISQALIAPVVYLVEVYQGTRKVWEFQAALSDQSTGDITLAAMYAAAEGSPEIGGGSGGVAGGKYRSMVYELDGEGGFKFITTNDGTPITTLRELE
jgi:hypothetical protein